jgi:transcriptional regulator with XRE-family HTH domain
MNRQDFSPEQQALRKRLSENVKRLRALKKISQEDLGAATGAHRTYVSKVERMVANPTLDNLAALAKVLEVDALDLLAHVTSDNEAEAPPSKGGKRPSASA